MSLQYCVELYNERDDAIGVAIIDAMFNDRGKRTYDRLDAASFTTQLPNGHWVSAPASPEIIHPIQ